MASAFESHVAAYLTANDLLPRKGSVLLAVSGGADSVAMLYALHALRRNGTIAAELFVGHVNHHLRGQASDGDEVFVLEQAKRLGIRALSMHVDVNKHATTNKLSTETAARHLRHEALARMAAEVGCSTIATAHHKDDNAETVIHRLLRGTGYRGLAGIWPKKEFSTGITCVRPLLSVSRSQIQEYMRQQGISWRQDASNENLDHKRNFIRHRLLPYMSLEAVGSLVDELAGLADASLRYYRSIVSEAEVAWERMVRIKGPAGVELDRGIFNGCPAAVRVEVVQRCLKEMGCGEQGMTAAHYYTVIGMATEPDGGRKLSLPGGVIVKSHHNVISVCAMQSGPTDNASRSAVSIPGESLFAGWKITTRILDAASSSIEEFRPTKTHMVEWFDFDSVCGKIHVRRRAQGDRFVPFGCDSEQKVGKFLTAARVADHLRSRIVVFEDEERVIWVAPIRACEETRITSRTKVILEVVVEPHRAGNPL